MRADAEKSHSIAPPMKGGEHNGQKHKIKTDNG